MFFFPKLRPSSSDSLNAYIPPILITIKGPDYFPSSQDLVTWISIEVEQDGCSESQHAQIVNDENPKTSNTETILCYFVYHVKPCLTQPTTCLKLVLICPWVLIVRSVIIYIKNPNSWYCLFYNWLLRDVCMPIIMNNRAEWVWKKTLFLLG